MQHIRVAAAPVVGTADAFVGRGIEDILESGLKSMPDYEDSDEEPMD